MKRFFNLFLMLLIFISSTNILLSQGQISAAERQALIDLYNATDGDNWTNIPGTDKWKSGGTFRAAGTEHLWYGVGVNSGASATFVESLVLVDNNLSGTITTSVGTFTDLETLVLSYNPDLTGNIPVEIDSLKNLIWLNLSQNGLSGTIPDIDSLVNLEYLQLNNNSLSGNIPDLTDVTSLFKLQLNDNDLTGSIPTSISSPSSMTYCALQNNSLDGSIPSQITSLTDLKFLNISVNGLTGILPALMSNFTSLEELYLQNNSLDGSLPTNFEDMTALINLNLSNNDFSGSLPTNFGDMNQLQLLDLSFNGFTGSLPASMSSLTSLQYLYLNNNDFDGDLPSGFTSMTALIKTDLSDNGFTGNIPSTINSLTNLTHMYWDNNQFDGSIPSNINGLSNLVVLDLSSNQLTGNLPDLSSLDNMTKCYLHNNEMDGNLPTSIGGMAAIQELFLNQNNFDGNLPAELFDLTTLTKLNLSDNQFDGSLSSDIQYLTSLKEFYVEGNGMSGSLPTQLSIVTTLEKLDVSRNQFSGTVPSSLTGLSNLTWFDMSDDDFNNLPDLSSGFGSLVDWYVQGNQFEFDDLEPNMNIASGDFVYSPQQSVPPGGSATINQGDSYSITATVGGSSNSYQWRLDNTPISGATSSTYSITSAVLADAGQYVCFVTSSTVTGLTLKTEPFDLTVLGPPVVETQSAFSTGTETANLKGYVSYNGGLTITERGFVWDVNSGPTTSINEGSVVSGNGEGAFEEDVSGLTPSTYYYVRAYAINSAGTSYGDELTFQTVGENSGVAITTMTFESGSQSLLNLPNEQEPVVALNTTDKKWIIHEHDFDDPGFDWISCWDPDLSWIGLGTPHICGGIAMEMKAGIEFGIYIQYSSFDDGSIDVTYPVTTKIEYPAGKTFKCEDQIEMITSVQVGSNYQLATESYYASGDYGLRFAYGLSLSGEVCFWDCADFTILNIGNGDFAANANSSNYLDYLTGFDQNFFGFGHDYAAPWDIIPGWELCCGYSLDDLVGISGEPLCIDSTLNIASLLTHMWGCLDGNANVADGPDVLYNTFNIRSENDSDFTYWTVDLTGFISIFPFFSLSGYDLATSDGTWKLSVVPLKVLMRIMGKEYQTFEFEPELKVMLEFEREGVPTNVEYRIYDIYNNPVGPLTTGNTIITDLTNYVKINWDDNTDPISVKHKYYMAQNIFRTEIKHRWYSVIDVEALKFGITFPGFSVGPWCSPSVDACDWVDVDMPFPIPDICLPPFDIPRICLPTDEEPFQIIPSFSFELGPVLKTDWLFLPEINYPLFESGDYELPGMDEQFTGDPFDLIPEDPRLEITAFDLTEFHNIGDGERTLRYEMTLANTGNVDLDNISAIYDLSTIFAAADKFYDVEISSSDFVLNPNYDGESVDEMLSPNSNTLQEGEEGDIVIEFTLKPQTASIVDNGCFEDITYQANVTAYGTSPLGAVVEDNHKACSGDIIHEPEDLVDSTNLGTEEIDDIYDFALYGEKKVKLSRGIQRSRGNVGSSDDIYVKLFGSEPGYYTTIYGDIHTGDDLKLRNSRLVCDYAQIGDDIIRYDFTSQLVAEFNESEGSDCVSTFDLPDPSAPVIVSGEEEIIVESDENTTLLPDDYDLIDIRDAKTVMFSTGTYNIENLKMQNDTRIIFDISGGPVTVNINNWNASLLKRAEFVIYNGSGTTEDVTFNYFGTDEIRLKKTKFQGILIAPNATVYFDKYSQLEGACYAYRVIMDAYSKFTYHKYVSSTSLNNGWHKEAEDLFAQSGDVQLLQNYPNPFSDETTIEFIMPTQDYINLSLYEISGRKIKDIAEGTVSEGLNSIIFDSGDLSDGVYIYVLTTTTGKYSQKMNILKK